MQREASALKSPAILRKAPDIRTNSVSPGALPRRTSIAQVRTKTMRARPPQKCADVSKACCSVTLSLFLLVIGLPVAIDRYPNLPPILPTWPAQPNLTEGLLYRALAQKCEEQRTLALERLRVRMSNATNSAIYTQALFDSLHASCGALDFSLEAGSGGTLSTGGTLTIPNAPPGMSNVLPAALLGNVPGLSCGGVAETSLHSAHASLQRAQETAQETAEEATQVMPSNIQFPALSLDLEQLGGQMPIAPVIAEFELLCSGISSRR